MSRPPWAERSAMQALICTLVVKRVLLLVVLAGTSIVLCAVPGALLAVGNPAPAGSGGEK